jgi:hypothetical protein
MPKLDNEPCGVEVPVIGHTGPGVIQRGQLTPLSVEFMAGHGVQPVPLCDFSVWLTPEAIRDRKLADSRDQGARKLNILLRKARKK